MKRSNVATLQQAGFTLVELLIALGLGVLLSFGLLQIFQSSRIIASTETALSRVQETGRFATDVIARDLRMIGYHGCADPNNMDITIMARTGAANFDTTSLTAFEVADNGTFSPTVSSGDDLEDIQIGTASSGNVVARPGSDVVRAKFAARTGARLTGNTAPNNANVVFDGNPTCLDQDDLVLISDCTNAHLFRNTNNTCHNDGTPVANNSGWVTFAHASNNNEPNKILPGYSAGAELLAYQDVTYFVGDSGRNTAQGDDIFSLYRVVNGNSPEELVEGVEFLQLRFGEVLASGNIRYVDADTSGVQFTDISSIQVGMLIQSFESALPQEDDRSYVVAGTTIPASGDVSHSGGRYLRKPFVTTIQLRNRRF
jgi:type IV pilus assembly protein PilW